MFKMQKKENTQSWSMTLIHYNRTAFDPTDLIHPEFPQIIFLKSHAKKRRKWQLTFSIPNIVLIPLCSWFPIFILEGFVFQRSSFDSTSHIEHILKQLPNGLAHFRSQFGPGQFLMFRSPRPHSLIIIPCNMSRSLPTQPSLCDYSLQTFRISWTMLFIVVFQQAINIVQLV